MVKVARLQPGTLVTQALQWLTILELAQDPSLGLQEPNSGLTSLCNFDHPAECSAEGEQEMPPQNMPLWSKNYFKLKTSEIQQMQKGSFVELSLSD